MAERPTSFTQQEILPLLERVKGEMTALLRAAVERGVTFFDTAEVYGPFVNESWWVKLSRRSGETW